jgi:hypothetical protein
MSVAVRRADHKAIEPTQPQVRNPLPTREIWDGDSNNLLTSETLQPSWAPAHRNAREISPFARIRSQTGEDSHIWESRPLGHPEMPDFRGLWPIRYVPVTGIVIAISGVSIGMDQEAKKRDL